MKTIVVLSGKGGTGKTSVTASLAVLEHREGRPLVLADADVDASNLPILLKPRTLSSEDFYAGEFARVNPELCNKCGLCSQRCRFDAITLPFNGGPAHVSQSRCEGCAVCNLVCPEKAISMEKRLVGTFSRGESRCGPMVYARLSPGGESSGKLVTRVREEASAIAGSRKAELILVDGPPGMGCPAVSSLTGADMAVMVTEPSPSARADLNRVLKLCEHFHIASAAIINKANLNTTLSGELEEELRSRGVRTLGRIPYDPGIAHAQQGGLSPVELEGPAAEALKLIHQEFRKIVDDIKGGSLPVRGRL